MRRAGGGEARFPARLGSLPQGKAGGMHPDRFSIAHDDFDAFAADLAEACRSVGGLWVRSRQPHEPLICILRSDPERIALRRARSAEPRPASVRRWTVIRPWRTVNWTEAPRDVGRWATVPQAWPVDQNHVAGSSAAANSSVASGFELTVFLVAAGVDWVRKGAADVARPNPLDPPIREMMDNVMSSGGQILVCPPCAKVRGYGEDALVEGVVIAGAPAMLEVVKQGASTLSF